MVIAILYWKRTHVVFSNVNKRERDTRMKNNKIDCIVNHYDEHLLKRGREYDFVWCGLDIELHRHMEMQMLNT